MVKTTKVLVAERKNQGNKRQAEEKNREMGEQNRYGQKGTKPKNYVRMVSIVGLYHDK